MKYFRPWKTYNEYVNSQTKTNKAKINNVWVSDGEIEDIAKWVKNSEITINSGVCHGVRNGYEVKRFRELLDADIIGTEISDTATQFENVIEWDFHRVKKEWIDKFDFIYSNSIDHSYDFEYCLDQWMKTLKKNGICFLQWSEGHTEAYYPLNSSDCFSVSPRELVELIEKKYEINSIFRVEGCGFRSIIAVQHKSIFNSLTQGK